MDQLLELFHKKGVKFCLLREKDTMETDLVAGNKQTELGCGVEKLRRLCLGRRKDRKRVGGIATLRFY